MQTSEISLFERARKCTFCIDKLPLCPKPIIQGCSSSKILIIGQAPGRKAHDSNIPWNDPSGVRLRNWLGVSENDFYDSNVFAILPMSFCYPGKATSGDLAPLKVCAPKWHPLFIDELAPTITILIGKYAQDWYLDDTRTLTERMQNWRRYLPKYLIMPHSSPRNNIWLAKNSWFELQTLPDVKQKIQTIIQGL